jgi:hypothetical protein
MKFTDPKLPDSALSLLDLKGKGPESQLDNALDLLKLYLNIVYHIPNTNTSHS